MSDSAWRSRIRAALLNVDRTLDTSGMSDADLVAAVMDKLPSKEVFKLMRV